MAVVDAQRKLIDLIKIKQNELIQVGLSKGVGHEETIFCSQQLDLLIYKMQKEIFLNDK